MGINMRGTNPDPNEGEFMGACVDAEITLDGTPDDQVSEAVDPFSDVDKLGDNEVYEVDGTNHSPGDQGATTPPHAPNKMAVEEDGDGIARSRDPYRNDGMIGQDFMQNQG